LLVKNTSCCGFTSHGVSGVVSAVLYAVNDKYGVKEDKFGSHYGKHCAAADMLYPLFWDIWNEECFPSGWKRGVLLLRSQVRDLSN
jgi:hypothetical protein